MEATPNRLGKRIRLARIRYGISQAELARALGINKNSMNKIEAGLTDPRASRIAGIAQALHCSTDYLLGLEDPDDDLVDTWETPAAAGAPPALPVTPRRRGRPRKHPQPAARP